MAIITKNDHARYWQGCGATRILSPGWWECEMVQSTTSENNLALSLKSKTQTLPYDLIIILVKKKAYIHVKTDMWKFLAALFQSKTRINPECPSSDEQINKLWYIHTIELYSSTQMNELSIHITTWIKSQNNYAGWKKPYICILHNSICSKL